MLRSLSLGAIAAIVVSVSAATVMATEYKTTFTALNDSGVQGTGFVYLDGDELTVHIEASGLQPNIFHPQHLHAQLNPNSEPSQVPTSLKKWDKNHNGMIDDIEGDAAMGNEAVYLTKNPDMENIYNDYAVASSKGTENFKQTYDVSEQLPFLEPLSIRGLELHGMTEDGKYVADFPVAAGLLHKVSGSSAAVGALSGNSSGANAAPLPPAVWAGALTMLLVYPIYRRRRFAL